MSSYPSKDYFPSSSFAPLPSKDDVDLDALVNGMSSFPVYNDERPLLESMENLSSHQMNSTPCHCGGRTTTTTSGRRTGDLSSPVSGRRKIPKPRLDWAWRSKSLSVEKCEDDSSSSSTSSACDLTLSSSYPERGFGSGKSLDETVPDPFPDLGGSPPGIKSCVSCDYVNRNTMNLSLFKGTYSDW